MVADNVERISLKNSRGLRIIGRLYKGSRKSCIVFCHGLRGEKSEWGNFERAIRTLNNAGYNVCTFDFSGSGESDDDSIAVYKWVDDFNSVLSYLRERGFARFGLVGLSTGALVALKSFNEGIKAMVLWAPITNHLDWQVNLSREQLEELRVKGSLTELAYIGIKKEIVLDAKLYDEIGSINQKQLLSRIGMEVLIIHGYNDTKVPVEHSVKALEYLPQDSKLEIIVGADHLLHKFFTGESADELVDSTLEWFLKRLTD